METMNDSVGQFSRKASDAVGDTGSAFFNNMSRNPVPLVLIGTGIGLLMANWGKRPTRQWDRPESYGTDRYSTASGDYGLHGRGATCGATEPSMTERARDNFNQFTGTVKEKMNSATDSLRDTAGNLTEQARHQMDVLSDQARQGYQRAGDTFQNVLRDNPLAVGVAALAAGALIGLLIPETEIENQYMGQTRDELMGKAQEAAREAVGKVQQVAQEAGRTIQEEAQRQGLGGSNQS